VFLALFCSVLLIANFGLFLECKGDHQKRVNGLTKRFGMEFFELNEEKVWLMKINNNLNVSIKLQQNN
jgi:hypothetical protein